MTRGRWSWLRADPPTGNPDAIRMPHEDTNRFVAHDGTVIPDILRYIGNSDQVTIRSPHGQLRTGHAVMRGPHGWVLNLGGEHGTPGIADERNIQQVKKRPQTKKDKKRHEFHE